MSRRFNGTRALGRMDPETRSAFLGMSRAMRNLSALQRAQPIANEAEAGRFPGLKQLSGPSLGGRVTTTTYGRDGDKPPATLLAKRGVGSFVYVATDTNKVYIWNGGAYKSATFA